ncbi:MAG: hypothetical protein KC618_09200 [Candidatus Omnitrophica bacterium]|nr:hypothetical protein [Candidatus Omnitrophota bacterium]
MTEKLNRVYQKLDPQKVKPHLMIYGDISASCAHCGAIDLKLTMPHCPECRNDFKYLAFRSVKSHIPKMYKLLEERPDLLLIDYDDYNRNLGASKAEGFFNS